MKKLILMLVPLMWSCYQGKCWGLTFSEVDTMLSDLNKKKLQVDEKYTLNFEIY